VLIDCTRASPRHVTSASTKTTVSMHITIDKGILILLYDTFCSTFDDNNRSVSSGFVQFRGKGLPFFAIHEFLV